MSTQLDSTSARLREALFSGLHAPNERLREVELADSMGVSRTLVRLAMGVLEDEGLLVREPNRGCRVRAFSVAEVCDAIEVRGELEAMAARKAAERGLDSEIRVILSKTLKRSWELLQGGLQSDEARLEWISLNQRFHDSIVQASGNATLGPLIKRLEAMPLASASAILFERSDDITGLSQLRMSLHDHERIVQAIEERAGSRASAIIREHAYRSAENKRRNLRDPRNREAAGHIPGIALVAYESPGDKDPENKDPGDEGPADTAANIRRRKNV